MDEIGNNFILRIKSRESTSEKLVWSRGSFSPSRHEKINHWLMNEVTKKYWPTQFSSMDERLRNSWNFLLHSIFEMYRSCSECFFFVIVVVKRIRSFDCLEWRPAWRSTRLDWPPWQHTLVSGLDYFCSRSVHILWIYASSRSHAFFILPSISTLRICIFDWIFQQHAHGGCRY